MTREGRLSGWHKVRGHWAQLIQGGHSNTGICEILLVSLLAYNNNAFSDPKSMQH
jgi:hypothetical protein